MENYKTETDKNASYWKEEAREHGSLKAANIDHLRPSYDTVIFMMEEGGEL